METTLDFEREEKISFFNKPSLMLRIKSMLIDSVVIFSLMLIISFILNSLNIESGRVRGLAFLIVLLYEPILITLKGTIGQRIMGLRVINSSFYKEENDRKNINFIFSILRYITKIFLGWISLLTIHSDQYGQAIHDKVGQSIMTFK